MRRVRVCLVGLVFFWEEGVVFFLGEVGVLFFGGRCVIFLGRCWDSHIPCHHDDLTNTRHETQPHNNKVGALI